MSTVISFLWEMCKFEKTTTEEKSIHVIKFSSKKEDWEEWYKRFLARERHQDYQALLIGADQMEGVDKVHAKEAYD